MAELVKSLVGNFPSLERETEYIALVREGEYPLYDGRIGSSDGGAWPVAEYRQIVNEYVVPHSTAKYARHNRDSYMVGALARFNLNGQCVSPVAKEAARSFDLEPVCYSPFMNNIAQLVECFHSVEDSMKLIDGLLAGGAREEEFKVEPKAGKGASAVEAPRGTLFHEYEYDKEGRCVNANLVIPTNQNHGNIQGDFEALLPTLLEKPDKEIELAMGMLVRAYDPCISCSAHVLEVRFER